MNYRIKHFGGPVTYDSRDFVSRNRDALDRELSQAMYECDHPILKVLFPEGKFEFEFSQDFGVIEVNCMLQVIHVDHPEEGPPQRPPNSRFLWERC